MILTFQINFVIDPLESDTHVFNIDIAASFRTVPKIYDENTFPLRDKAEYNISRTAPHIQSTP